MHPSRHFEWTDEAEMLAFVGDISFATIFVASGGANFVVHAPVLVAGERRLLFHVARRNRAAGALEGGNAILSCLGPDAYVSPDWYGTDDQAPTWNYLVVEAEGPLRKLHQDELVELLDGLSATHEGQLAPKPAWTRDKMSEGRFERMCEEILGFELRIEALRGTRKLGQNKSRAEIEAAASRLREAGKGDMAELMLAEPPST